MNSTDVSSAWKIDEICHRFEEKLKSGDSPRIERELKELSATSRNEVLLELLILELWYLRKQNQAPPIDDYLLRFPDDKQTVCAAFEKVEDQPTKAPLSVAAPINLEQMRLANTILDKGKADLSHSLSLPEKFGRYRIIRRIGSGAMGSVFLADDEELDRQVALKIPRFLESENHEHEVRFRREAQAAAGLSHPNLCPVYDIGEIDGIFYITMQFIDGQPLSKILEEGRSIQTIQAIKLVRSIAKALAEAHSNGIIHRDLKPSNIMINPKGQPIVVDFGLARTELTDVARLTAPGAILGTPAYASPEQIDGHHDIDSRSDVFSLGMILYEMLTGTIPYDFAKPLTLLQQIAKKAPPAPSKTNPAVAEDLDEVCLKALAKKPNERFQSMREFEIALAKVEAIMPEKNNSRPIWFRSTKESEAPQPATKKVGTVSNAGAGKVPTTDFVQLLRDELASFKQRVGKLVRSIAPIVKVVLALTLVVGLIWTGMQIQPILTPSTTDLAQKESPSDSGSVNNKFEFNNTINGRGSDDDESNLQGHNGEDDGGKEIVNPPPSNPNPELPDMRVQLPIPVGGWTHLEGSIAIANLPEIIYSVRMRAVENRKTDDRNFQVIEFDVRNTNTDYHEQASLLIDVAEFRDFRRFVVKAGWVLAPKANVQATFDAEIDEIAHAFRLEGLETLPEHRLSVHDVLALLFQADVKTTHTFYSDAHITLRNELHLKNQRVIVNEPEKNGPDYHHVETVNSEDGSENPVDYSPIQITLDSKKRPFNWKRAIIKYRQLGQLEFDATLEQDGGNIEGAVAEFSPPEWSPEKANPIRYEDYAFLTLPEEPGAWCSFEVNLRVPRIMAQTLKLPRVEVTVLEPEIVDNKQCRWIEVRTQIGGDLSSSRIVESVKLLFDEKRYREKREFDIIKAGQMIQIGKNDPLYSRFDLATDRMSDYYKEQLPPNRLPIRNVLSLMFGAELEPHFLDFSIRRHITFALIDGKYRRHFVPNRKFAMSANLEDEDLDCTLVRPGRKVSIVKKGNLPPTTLDYKIFVTSDDKKQPFRWVKLDVDLFGHEAKGPGPRIFGGYLQLREVGKGVKSQMPELDEILRNDPEEVEHRDKAASMIRLAEKFIESGRKPEAIKRYEQARDINPDTLTAKLYQKKIDELRR